MGAEYVVLISQSRKVKNYARQNLEMWLRKLSELDNSTIISIACYNTSNKEAVILLLSSIYEKYGKINTVIHTSEILCDSPLHKLDSEAVKKKFDTKVAGA